jgi:hypothetical protein
MLGNGPHEVALRDDPCDPSASAITNTEPIRRVVSCWPICAKVVPGVTVNTRPPF